MGPNAHLYDLEVWHRRAKELRREAEEARLARGLKGYALEERNGERRCANKRDVRAKCCT